MIKMFHVNLIVFHLFHRRCRDYDVWSTKCTHILEVTSVVLGICCLRIHIQGHLITQGRSLPAAFGEFPIPVLKKPREAHSKTVLKNFPVRLHIAIRYAP